MTDLGEGATPVALPEGYHLREFNDGFRAGYRGERRETGRSGTYRNAHARGADARKRTDEFAAGRVP